MNSNNFSSGNGPPWDLSDCSKYRYFICPESICEFMSHNELTFKTHMKEFHSVTNENEIKVEDLDEDDKGNNSNFSLENDVDIKLKIDRLKKFNVKVIKNYNTRNKKTNYNDISKDGFISVNCRSCGFLFDSIIELRDHLKDEHPEILNQSEKTLMPPPQKLFPIFS